MTIFLLIQYTQTRGGVLLLSELGRATVPISMAVTSRMQD